MFAEQIQCCFEQIKNKHRAEPLELLGLTCYVTIYMVMSVTWTRSIWRMPRHI